MSDLIANPFASAPTPEADPAPGAVMHAEPVSNQVVQSMPVQPAQAPATSAPSASDSYDSIISGMPPPAGNPATPYRLNVMQAADENPDVAARVQALGKKYNIAPGAIQLQQADYERRATVDAIDYDSLISKSPSTAALLAQPNSAAVTYDDTHNLSGIEKAVRALAGTLTPSIPGLYSGADALNSAEALGAQPVKNLGGAAASVVPATAGALYGVARAGADALATAASPLVGTILPENPFERMAATVAGWQQQQNAAAKSLMPQTDSAIANGIYSGVQSVGQTGAALIAGLATGGVSPVLGLLAAIQGGQAYGQARDQDVPFQQALPYAASQAAIEYAMAHLPVARFLHDFKAGTPFYSMFARQIAAQVPNDQIATALQDLNTWATLTPEKPITSYLEERPSAAAQTLVSTIVSAGALSGAAHGIQAVGERMRGEQERAQQAQQTGAVLGELDQAAAASKVRPRDADLFGQFVKSATEDGPVQDVYIDAQHLAQSGVDVGELARRSPSVAAQLPEASATGGSIRIPLDEYATNIAGTDLSGQLLPYLKTDPLGMTQQEAETFMQGGAEQFQKEVERTLTAQAPDEAFKASRDAVQQDIAQRLNEVNRFTPQVNQQYATLLSNFYAVQGARLGVTPEEMAARYPLNFSAHDLTTEGEGLSQGANPERERIHASTQPISEQDARTLVEGKTEKPGGVNPTTWLGREGATYRIGDVPLDLFVGNEEGNRYDGTVDEQRAADYATRNPEGSPPVIATQGRKGDGKLRIMDGGHRISAARMRGDTTIRAIVRERTPTVEQGEGLSQPRQTLPAPSQLNEPRVPTAEEMQQHSRDESVPLDKAVSFQSARDWDKFNAGDHPGDLVAGYGGKPVAVKLRTGEYVVYDGNHRADLALQAGKTALDMHVIDAADYDPANAGRAPVEDKTDVDALLRDLLGQGPIDAEAHNAFVTGIENEFPGVKLDLMNGRNTLNLSRIVVPEDQRNSGVGTQVMQRVVDYADQNGRTIALSPSADFGGDVSKLREFYKRFGFVDNKGKNRDDSISETMYRAPTPESLGQGAIAQTESPQFKEWFGGSKAIDAGGKPLLLYHGTGADFTEFKPSETYENGIYFTPDPRYAAGRARINAQMKDGAASVYPVYVAIKNPAPPGMSAAEARARGHDGLIRGEGRSLEYVAFSPEQIKSAVGNSGAFDPTNPSIVNQGERGGLIFPEGINADITKVTPTLALLKDADLSTFLHENGHFYLEVMNHIAAQENAPQELKDDFAAVTKWFGTTPEAWRAMPFAEKEAMHEQFARGFEAYLMEGKAPSQELRGVFQKVRAWMVNVYRSMTRLNVTLTPEVRSVFDRLLATSDAIAEQRTIEGAQPLFDSKPPAMTDAEWQSYQNSNSEAQQEALETLQERSMRDMKWLSNARSKKLKDLQKQADSIREATRQQVADAVYATPTYGAMDFFKHGRSTVNGEPVELAHNHKLDIDALTEMYGGEGDKFATLDWSKLGYGKYGMLGKDGVHPDQAAQLFGFTSGDHMIRALLGAEPVNSVIEGLTDTRMLQEHGDLTDQNAMNRAADQALHNDARARFVATELNALQKATGKPSILARAARQFAEQMVSRQKVRDIKPSQYTAAEGRAARASEQAFKKDDIETAALEKRNQLVNTYAAKEAYAAQDEIRKTLDYFGKFDRPASRKSIDSSYIDQIDGLLDRYDLRKGQTLTAIDKRKSLVDWVQSQQEMGYSPVIDDSLLNEARRQSYKDMTVEELRGLRDAVKNIEHLGRLKKKLLTAQDNRDFAEARDAVADSIDANAKKTLPDQRSTDRGVLISAKSMFKGFLSEHRKFASLVQQFDGFKDGGPAWENLARNMNAAGDFEAVENEKAGAKLNALYDQAEAGGRLSRKTFVPEVNRSMSREEMLGIALNLGNSINKERVMSGEKWSQAQVDAITKHLSESDWKYVQGMWDFVGSYKDQIAAKERRLTGIEPKWVEAEPVQTPYGELRGGYYPISYDSNRIKGSKAEADTEAAVHRQMTQGLYTRTQTLRGHLKERTESTGRPMRYDLNVAAEHVQQVIHDLAWHEYLIDANRLLNDTRIQEAIRTHYGPEVHTQLRNALRDVAVGYIPSGGNTAKLFGYLRSGATVVGLGYNLTTALTQVFGFTQSAVRIGPQWMVKGIAHWGAGAAGLEKGTKDMYEMSPFMRTRGATMQREINEIRNRVGQPEGNWFTPSGLVTKAFGHQANQKVQASYFYLIEKMQGLVDVPTWWGAYEKAMAQEGMTQDKAAAMADQAVIDSQGSGQLKDLSGIERGSPFQKLFTTFYSFANAQLNLTARSFGRTDFTKPREVAMFAADMALLYFIPTALITLTKAAMRGDDDEDKLKQSFISDQISSLMGTLVGVREFSALSNIVTGGHADYSGPAGLRIGSAVYKFAAQAQQGEADEAFWKALNSTAGIVFHYPAAQIQNTVSGVAALANGGTQNPGAIFVGAPRK